MSIDEAYGIIIRDQLSDDIFDFENDEMLGRFAKALENDPEFKKSLTCFIVAYLDGYSIEYKKEQSKVVEFNRFSKGSKNRF